MSRRTPWLLMMLWWMLVTAGLFAQDDAKPQTFAEEAARRWAEGVRRQKLPWLDEDRMASLQKEMADFVVRHEPAEMAESQRRAILKAIDGYKTSRLGARGYLEWPDDLKTFQWKVSSAMRPLTDVDVVRRALQRDTIRKFVMSLPEQPGVVTHEQVLAKMDKLYNDPLNPVFREPMNEEQYTRFKGELDEYTRQMKKYGGLARLWVKKYRRPATAVASRLTGDMLFAKCPEALSDIPTPFEGDAVNGWLAGGGEVSLWFKSTRKFRGRSSELHDYRKTGVLLDASAGTFRLEGDVGSINDLEALLKARGKGDLCYDDAEGRLVAVRGAKLSLLDVTNWLDADRITDQVLRGHLAKTGAGAVSLAALRDECLPKQCEANRFAALITGDGRLAVLRLGYFTKEGGVRMQVRTR